MMRFTKDRRGFTMIELMVVVVIVAILAAIAIPLYGKYIDNARTSEASGRLGEVLTASKAWYQENDTWPTQTAIDNNQGVLDFRQSQYFTYDVTSGQGGTGTYVVTATGRSDAGHDKMAGWTVVLTASNVDDAGSIVATPPSN